MTTPNDQPIDAYPTAPSVNDDHSRWGWTHPHEVLRTGWFVDLHKVGSLIATAAASVMISGAYAEANRSSDEHLNIGWQTTDRSSYIASAVQLPQQTNEMTVSSRTVTGPAGPRRQSLPFTAATMPDVVSFDLDATPAAQVILSNLAFNEYIQNIAEQVKQGWRIDSAVIDGKASTETRLDASAGLDRADPPNLSLAGQYQAFVRQAAVHALAEHGVILPNSRISGTPREVELTKDQLATFEQIRERANLPTNLALVERYKANPERLPEADRRQLAVMFDANRGADITITLASPTGATRTTTYETTSNRCVIIETTVETTVQETKRKHHNIPIMLVPFPIARIRRDQSKTVSEPLVDDPDDTPYSKSVNIDKSRTTVTDQSKISHQETPSNHDTVESKAGLPEFITWYEVSDGTIKDPDSVRHDIEMFSIGFESRRFIAAMNSDIPGYKNEVAVSDLDTMRLERLRALAQHFNVSFSDDGELIDNLRSLLTRQRSSRLIRKIGASTAALIGLAAIPFVVKGDVGYCPQPQDHLSQDWRWNDIPDYLDLRLHVPFTDIDSGRTGDLAGSYCYSGQSAPVTPQPGIPAEPTCDTRTVVIRDGRIISSQETHYPGALMQTTRAVPGK